MSNRSVLRVFNTCISYNGTSSQGALSNSPMSVVNNWSMAAWIKPLTLPQLGFILYNGNDSAGYGLSIGSGSGSSGNNLQGLAGSVSWVGSGPTMINNNWQHVGLVLRAGTWFFYFNGKETNSGSTAVPNTPTTGRGSIGMEYSTSNTASHFVNALIDFARMWNVALSAEQMFDNYNMDFVPPGCVLELKGTSGTDTSGQGNNATYSSTSTTTSNTSANILRTILS